jgi:hypothetical protein
MARADENRRWIVDQVDLMLDILNDDIPVKRVDVLAAAHALIGTEGWEDYPDVNTRAEQSNWLQGLLEASVKKAGGELATGQKDPIPQGGKWEGPASDLPPGFPGR